MNDENFFALDCRMTKDMETKVTKNGKTLASFGVCYNDSYQKDGEWVKKPNFWDCTAFGKAADYLFHKGELVHIEGAMSVDTWEKDGKKFSKTVLKVFKIESKDRNGSAPNTVPRPNAPSPRPVAASASPASGDDGGIPF
jgi:single stranded DNA-binding protein